MLSWYWEKLYYLHSLLSLTRMQLITRFCMLLIAIILPAFRFNFKAFVFMFFHSEMNKSKIIVQFYVFIFQLDFLVPFFKYICVYFSIVESFYNRLYVRLSNVSQCELYRLVVTTVWISFHPISYLQDDVISSSAIE